MEPAINGHGSHDSFIPLVGALLVLVGLGAFTASYLIPMVGGRYQGVPVQHLYNVLLLLWPVFFLLQASLATSGHSRRHRSFGMAGISLATAIEFTGFAALIAVLENARAQGLHATDLAGIGGTTGFAGLLLFSIFFAWAVIRRRRIDVHKRMMLLATVALMQQPVSEIGFVPLIPPHLLLIVVVLAIVCLRDLRVRGHIHPVNLAGGGVLLAIQGLQYWWVRSPLWQNIVNGLLVFGE